MQCFSQDHVLAAFEPCSALLVRSCSLVDLQMQSHMHWGSAMLFVHRIAEGKGNSVCCVPCDVQYEGQSD